LKNAHLVGEPLRYVVTWRGQWLAVATWSAAALHLKPRDRFIGWSEDQRRLFVESVPARGGQLRAGLDRRLSSPLPQEPCHHASVPRTLRPPRRRPRPPPGLDLLQLAHRLALAP